MKLSVEKQHTKLVDAISHGASDGLKVGLNVVAMLIGFIALIALADYMLGFIGRGLASFGDPYLMGYNVSNLSLKDILGSFFSLIALAMGVPLKDIQVAGALMGEKMVINEFVA